MNEFSNLVHITKTFLQAHPGVLICTYGVIGVLGVLWQRELTFKIDPRRRFAASDFLPDFLADIVPRKTPKRAVIPYLVGISIIVGAFIYTVMNIDLKDCVTLDHVCKNQNQEAFAEHVKLLLVSIGFWILITLKARFSPVILMVQSIYSLNQFVNDHPIDVFPVLRGLLEFVFKLFPNGFEEAYIAISFFYLFASASYDLFR